MLFILIAERHERRSLGITSNLVFSQWRHIFANPMSTVAAIYRTGAAKHRGREQEVNQQRIVSVFPAGIVNAKHRTALSDVSGSRTAVPRTE